jgi:Na+/H+ antiporter NhaD/arsenite permease-like protein
LITYTAALGAITLLVLAAVAFLVFIVPKNRKRDQGKYDNLLSLPAEELAEQSDGHPLLSL